MHNKVQYHRLNNYEMCMQIRAAVGK